MNATRQSLFLSSAFILFLTTNLTAATQFVLERRSTSQQTSDITGVVELIVKPGFHNAKVSITVDGSRVATHLIAPWRFTLDFGPTPVQHKIGVIAVEPNGRRTQWTQIINRGSMPLSVRIRQLNTLLFEAEATAPEEDPIVAVELWQDAKVIASVTEAPYRFQISAALLATGFVQVTARTRSGDEAADFWSAGGQVVAGELQVRTIPIFVSVVDGNGSARDDVDRSQFRIIDNDAEAKIVEFGKAFDQPISIALLVDASTSMTYAMAHVSKAAAEFVARALKDGDRCSVTAIQDVPRRKHALSGDRTQIARAVTDLVPAGRTALYDAVISAMRELREEKNRRAIVILTDGGDTSSNYSYEDVKTMAREAGIPMYFIAYADGGDPQDLDRLRYLASETGGFVATATEENLRSRYAAIEKDLRAQFAITYQVSNFGPANEYHRVRVVMHSPKLTARTIKGYFMP